MSSQGFPVRRMPRNASSVFVKAPRTTAQIRSRFATHHHQDEENYTENGQQLVDDIQELKQSHGGFLRHKRSAEEKETISRARAQQLSEMYELSDFKADSLNKHANFKKTVTCAPKLSTIMTPQQAVAAWQLQQKEHLADPLLTEHEQKEIERRDQVEQRKVAVAGCPAPGFVRAPLMEKRQQQQPRSGPAPWAFTKARSHSKTKPMVRIETTAVLYDDEGMEVIPTTPGEYSVESTVAETPSPAYRTFYVAENGVRYEVSNLC
jgi:hypothetical protein